VLPRVLVLLAVLLLPACAAVGTEPLPDRPLHHVEGGFRNHWGTFDLADEPLGEPPARMLAEARRRGLPTEQARILRIGETRRW
jgi:hypothetical protein